MTLDLAHWPQIVILFIMTMRLGIALFQWGKPKNIDWGPVDLFNFVLMAFLLGMGGFFS